MVNEKVVEGVMRSALSSISKKDKISLNDLRIKMKITEDKKSVECFILEKTDFRNNLSWSRILGMKFVFANIIIDSIKNSLLRLSKENGIEISDINARIYAIDDTATPNIYIYNGKIPIKKIELSDIL
jgi:hypothetical protein